MKFDVDKAEIKASNIPHEIFLTNLIVNHILYFVIAVGLAKSLPEMVMLVPIISVAALGYILIQGRRIQQSGSWFVRCHWRIAMKRSRLLILMITILSLLLALLYAIHIYAEVPFAQIIPLAAITTMPVMITVLALIVMQSEALHFSRTGQLPNSMVEQFPPPSELKVIKE